MLTIAGFCIAASIYFPIWRIELDAPQYPEGLALQIFANKLAGDVDVINGLNHYIGMKTLHSEDFWEFTYLPYILGFFVLFTFIVAYLKKRTPVLMLLIAFLVFGVLSMVDFWKWEYAYGHDLDPTAAIQIPGMAYQPPLIGFKQLLNFGAYSIPDIGGWAMILGGLIIAFVYFKESGWLPFLKKSALPLATIVLFLSFNSCQQTGPEPISLFKDTCEHCKMKISEGHFASELKTKKGRVYKFDDIYCLIEYKKENPDVEIAEHFVHYFPGENELIPAESAFYVNSKELKSPMAGNMAAFKTDDEANKYAVQLNGQKLNWGGLFE